MAGEAATLITHYYPTTRWIDRRTARYHLLLLMLRRPFPRFRSRGEQVLFASGLCVYALAAVLAGYYEYFDWDLRLARAIQSLSAPWLKPLMVWVSALGSGWIAVALALTAGLTLIGLRLRTEGLICLAGLGLGRLVTSLLKLISGRPRPNDSLVQIIGGFHERSFPSGHVIFFVELFGFLFFLAFVLAKPGLARTAGLVILATMIGLVGVSRIYLGAHWPSDVIGGYIAGGLWLMLMIETYRHQTTKTAASGKSAA
ncbi:MAG: phosphatase PAP2 family protein [Blastocatellia bacterium]